MRSVRLGDVAKFIRGVTFKPVDVVPSETDGAIRCMRTKNVQSTLDTSDVWSIDSGVVKREEQYLHPGDLLVSSANSWNLVGKCSWVPEMEYPATFGGFVSVLRGDGTLIDKRYLYHWFAASSTQATVRSFSRQTTNIANLDLKRCLELQIPLPPLAEQKRVAAVLDHVEALRGKRRQAIGLLDDLARSIFLDMFGDPLVNPNDWLRVPLRELLKSVDSGRSPQCLAHPAGPGEWGVLKLGAVTKCVYLADENKALPEGEAADPRHEVQAGDLLFTRKNTPELVAACAYVWNTPGRLLLPDLIFRLTVADDSVVNKVYLHALLTYPPKRAKVRELASGSSASMPNISKAKLLNFQCEIPPIGLQREFADRIRYIEGQKEEHRAHLAALDELFISLRQRAFAGELWEHEAA
ncbi:restriction endonuclease subunit S [Streptomyces sp. NPDC052496]|uniref:restriction endonuclease subunit S n=1 Tax=Streptomyces sp. NPDC052496 TaxID=3154951 RepID=UPI00341DDCBC